jgi:hypothetical protein
MRHKLALTIALASFCAVTALGAAVAGASAPSPSSAAQPTTPLSTTPTTPTQTVPACSKEVGHHHHGSPTHKAETRCQPPSESGEETTATTPSTGVKHGASIGFGKEPGAARHESRTGAAHRQRSSGDAANGGVSAPSFKASTRQAKGTGAGPGDGGSPVEPGSTAASSFESVSIGVSDFAIGSFEIPPLLLPVYQACGTQYGIPWEVLAAINKVETDFGTDLGPSSAGAEGWMQFLPSTWATWGVDANGDGRKDPNNPVDAICAAARYLAAAGGAKEIFKAVLAYNHADWYAREVLSDAQNYESLPSNLVSALTQLAEGSNFPVRGKASYADNAGAAEALQRNWLSEATASAAAKRTHPSAAGIDIYAAAGSPVVAVANGVILKVGHSAHLGNYMVLQDAYGSRFTYADLGEIRSRYRTPKAHQPAEPTAQLAAMKTPAPNLAASGERSFRRRLYALPGRPANRARAALVGQLGASSVATKEQRLGRGARVVAGTVLAQVGDGASGSGAHINFSIQPDGSPTIDPTAILDGWRRGGAGAIYHSARPLAQSASPAQVLLLSSEDLRRRSLSDPHLSLPSCEQSAIRAGQVERRVLAGIEYLTAQGFSLGIAPSSCANHSGFVVKIDRVNGTSVLGHQGVGDPPHELAQATLRMQGAVQPQEVVSTMRLGSVSVASDARPRLIDLDFYPPQTASLIGGKAIAPINAPPAVQAMIAAANHISTTPYIWGGGHGSWNSPGYDCSGSVSYVLHAAHLLSTPLTSGALESWGQPGSGRWVTVYANAGHTYAEIAGLRWDTVGDAQGTGPRWHTEPPYPAGFVVRHPAGY